MCMEIDLPQECESFEGLVHFRPMLDLQTPEAKGPN
jgi:hypothetical protein